MIRFPIALDEVERFKSVLGVDKPTKPYAFIFGHGLWNVRSKASLSILRSLTKLTIIQDLDLQATVNWLDQVLEMITTQLPYLAKRDAFFPRLILTPNASGRHKPDQWLVSQGNKALQIFEESVKSEAERRGIEHLGTWNMSIQANKFDGVHVDLKGNLIKAMMVLNWLNLVQVEKY